MMTLRQFAQKPESIPTATSWYLADLGEARGKQQLYTRQSPQKLKALREQAIIQSAVSSNRIEGAEIDQRRVRTVVFGTSLLRDRNEEEVRGSRLRASSLELRASSFEPRASGFEPRASSFGLRASGFELRAFVARGSQLVARRSISALRGGRRRR